MKKITKWTLLEEKDISPSKYFPLFLQTVKIHDGSIIDDYYIAKLSYVAMIVAISSKKEIIFVRQFKQGIGEITLELPAGQTDGSNPEEAALKELKEETGIIASNIIPLGPISLLPPKCTIKSYGFLVENAEISEEQDLESTENIEVIKIPTSKIDEMIIEGSINCADTIAFITKARLVKPELFI